LAGKVENEGSDLERHLLGFAHGGFRLGLDHLQLIAPWAIALVAGFASDRYAGATAAAMIQPVGTLSPNEVK